MISALLPEEAMPMPAEEFDQAGIDEFRGGCGDCDRGQACRHRAVVDKFQATAVDLQAIVLAGDRSGFADDELALAVSHLGRAELEGVAGRRKHRAVDVEIAQRCRAGSQNGSRGRAERDPLVQDELAVGFKHRHRRGAVAADHDLFGHLPIMCSVIALVSRSHTAKG